ncbi:uncharacterized protein KZ484_011865 isoform 2-T2 [Pholidichthys leucotaenia]
MTSVSKIKSHRLDIPQQNDFDQEEVLDEQQLLNQERNFIVVQVEADCSQIKEEQEDVCISQEGEQFGLKQEPQTFDEALCWNIKLTTDKRKMHGDWLKPVKREGDLELLRLCVKTGRSILH